MKIHKIFCMNRIFILSTLIININFMNCMQHQQSIASNNQDQPLREATALIKNRKLSPFFAWLEKQDYDWLWENQKEIKAIIETDKLSFLGIDPKMKDQVIVTNQQKKRCKKHELMSDGLDCALQDLSDKKVQDKFDSMFFDYESN